MTSRDFPVLPLYNYATLRLNRGCLNCRHFHRESFTTCDAFPDGIPLPIMAGERAHSSSYPGDNGIHWEPALDMPLGLPPGVTPADTPEPIAIGDE